MALNAAAHRYLRSVGRGVAGAQALWLLLLFVVGFAAGFGLFFAVRAVLPPPEPHAPDLSRLHSDLRTEPYEIDFLETLTGPDEPVVVDWGPKFRVLDLSDVSRARVFVAPPGTVLGYYAAYVDRTDDFLIEAVERTVVVTPRPGVDIDTPAPLRIELVADPPHARADQAEED